MSQLTPASPALHCSCAKYYEQGARFAKWRAVLKIGNGCPSGAPCVEAERGSTAACQPHQRICAQRTKTAESCDGLVTTGATATNINASHSTDASMFVGC